MKAVCDYESSKAEFLEIGREEGAAREREKWESEVEALKRELERLRAGQNPTKN
jgi:hypothetical protein